MNRVKRTLAMLLTLLMLANMLPASAMADVFYGEWTDATGGAQLLADDADAPTMYDVGIVCIYQDDGAMVQPPLIKEVEAGKPFSYELPAIPGFDAYIGDDELNVSGGVITTLSVDAVNADANYMIVYVPQTVDYTVAHQYAKHPVENQTLQGVVRTMTEAEPVNKAGYIANAFEQEKIDPAGTTVEITYDYVDYTVVFHSQGGTFVEAQQANVDAGSLTLGSPVQGGYSFAGWYTAEGASKIESLTGADVASMADDKHELHLYAHWTGKPVNFIVNYWKQKVTDTLSTPDAQKQYDYAGSATKQANAGTRVTASTYANKETGSTRYDFYGFRANAGKNNVEYEVKGDGTTIVNVYYDRVKCTVVYQTRERGENSYTTLKTHSGLYQQNLAADDWQAGYYWYENSEQEGSNCILLTNYDFARAGYTSYSTARNGDMTLNFYGRKNNNNAEVRYYLENLDGSYTLVNTVITGGGDLNVHAKYAGYDLYKAIYKSKNSVNVPSDKIVPASTWDNGSTVRDGSKIDSDHYPIAIANTLSTHRITYNNKGSETQSGAIKYTAPIGEQYYFVPEHPGAETLPTYYAFTGWCTDEACTQEFVFDGSTTMPNADLILYARWEPQVFDVTFHENYEGGKTSTLESIPGGSKLTEEQAYTPVRSGYNFKGWYTDEALTKPYTIDTVIEAETHLYAKWETKVSVEYTVYYWNVGDTMESHTDLREPDTMQGPLGQPITIAAKPVDGMIYTQRFQEIHLIDGENIAIFYYKVPTIEYYQLQYVYTDADGEHVVSQSAVKDNGKKYSILEKLEIPEGYESEQRYVYVTEFGPTEDEPFLVKIPIIRPTVDVSGVKTWIDGENSNNTRPAAITVKLLADGSEVDKATVDTAYNTYGWTGLPRYSYDAQYQCAGAIAYTVEEESVTGYTPAVDGYDITNTLTDPKDVTVTGTKTWVDGGRTHDNAKEITLNLLRKLATDAEWTPVTATPVWNGSTYTFSGLERYDDNGYAYLYDVTEAEIPAYTTVKNGLDFTNTIKTGVLTVSKTVSGLPNNGEDTFTFTVTNAAGDVVATLKMQNGESKSADLQPGTYTVTESDDSQHRYTVSATVGGTPATVTNNGVQATVEAAGATRVAFLNAAVDAQAITVTKTWDDAIIGAANRPAKADFQVKLDADKGEQYDVTVSGEQWLGEGDVWTATVSPRLYDDNGNKITYTVSETEAESYTPDAANTKAIVPADGEKTVALKNVYDTVTFTVKKTVTDETEADQHYAGTFPVVVKVDVEKGEIADRTLSLAADGSESVTVPVGSRITVTETVTGWETTYAVNAGAASDALADYAVADGDEVIVHNTRKTVSRSVEKVWQDDSNRDGLRSESIEVVLLKDGAAFKTATLSADNRWTAEWTKLPEYSFDESGAAAKAEYAVQEISKITGYTTAYATTGTKTVITNTHAIDTTSVRGAKTWVDGDDENGTRPESIEVALLANGSPAVYADGTAVAKLTVTAQSDWTYEWTGLPAKAAGEAIVYTVREVGEESSRISFDGVSYDVAYDGCNITNSLTQENDVKVVVTKAWIDPEGTAHEALTITLYRDGVQAGTLTLTDAKRTDAFESLPKYDPETGARYVYTVEEAPVAGYEAAYSPAGGIAQFDGAADDEATVQITNSRSQDTGLSIEVNKVWQRADGSAPEVELTLQRRHAGSDDAWSAVGEAVTTADLGYTFSELDKYDLSEAGKAYLYEYRVVETPVDGCSTWYAPAGGVVTVANGLAAQHSEVTVTNVVDQDNTSTDVSFNKKWVDTAANESNRGAVTVQLLASEGGAFAPARLAQNTLVLSADDDASTPDTWGGCFDDLPRYAYYRLVDGVETLITDENGCYITDTADFLNEIVRVTELRYGVKETAWPDAYEGATTEDTAAPYELVNVIRSGELSVTVNKTWTAPAYVTAAGDALFLLQRKDAAAADTAFETVGTERTVDGLTNGSVAWTGLTLNNPETKDAFVYRVLEKRIVGYDCLLGGAAVTSSVTVDGTEYWVLPVNTGTAGKEQAVLNVNNRETESLDLTVTKTVVDESPAASDAAFSFKLEWVDGETRTAVANAKDANGEEITDANGVFTLKHGETAAFASLAYGDYQVTEMNVDGNVWTVAPAADAIVTATAADRTVAFTNTRSLTDVDLDKTWIDNGNLDGTRPASIELKAQVKVDGQWTDAEELWPGYATETVTVDTTVTAVADLDENGGVTQRYEGLFADLPAFDESGEAYEYRAVEVNVDSKYGMSQNTDSTIVNTLQPGETEIGFTKTWVDRFNTEGRPAVDAYASGWLKLWRRTVNETGWTDVTGQGDWNSTASGDVYAMRLTGLDQYDARGARYEYRLSEIIPAGSDYVLTAGSAADIEAIAGSVIEDQAEIVNTLQRNEEITVSKTWLDGEDALDELPDVALTIALTRAFKAQGDALTDDADFAETCELTADNGWAATFGELPKYTADGTLYVYSVKETGETDGTILLADSQSVEREYAVDYDMPDAGNGYGAVVTNTRQDDEKEEPEKTAEKTVLVTYVDENGEVQLATVGQEITYTISWHNYHNVTKNVTITDTLNDYFTYVDGSATESGAYDPATRTITWALGEQAPFAKGVVEFTVVLSTLPEPDEGVSIAKNVAKVQLGDDPTTDFDEPEIEIEVANPELEVVKTEVSEPANGESYALGETVEYQVTVKNTGSVTLSQIAVEDTLVPDAWKGIDEAERDDAGHILELAPNETVTFTYTYQAVEDDVWNTRIDNTVRVSADDPTKEDESRVSDESSVTVPVDEPNPEFKVVKTLTNLPERGYFLPGETAEFDITVTNTGNVTIDTITVSETLEGATFVDGTTVAVVKSLAPSINGSTDNVAVLKAVYHVTEDDLGNKALANTLSAEGEIPTIPDPIDPDPIDPVPIPVDDATAVAVEKLWNDQENKLKTRPDSIVIHLLADGQVIRTAKVAADEAGAWLAEFAKLPVHNAAGDRVAYTVKEAEIEGYEAAYAANEDATAWTVTNSLEQYELIVRYVYQGGAPAADTYYDTLYFGEGYSVASPVIDGFTASIRLVAGSMPAHDLVYTVVYVPILTELGAPIGNVVMNAGDCFE